MDLFTDPICPDCKKSGLERGYAGCMGQSPRARRIDPSTSHEAATKLRGTKRLVGLFKTIVEYVRDCPDSTMGEAVEVTRIPNQSLTPRYSTLCREGFIEVSGKRKCKITGSTCQTYRVKE